MGYYERWISAIEALLIEKNVLTKAEIDRKAEQIVEQRKVETTEGSSVDGPDAPVA